MRTRGRLRRGVIWVSDRGFRESAFLSSHQLDERGVERVQVHGKSKFHLHVAVGVVLPQLPQVLAQRAGVANAVDLDLPVENVVVDRLDLHAQLVLQALDVQEVLRQHRGGGLRGEDVLHLKVDGYCAVL